MVALDSLGEPLLGEAREGDEGGPCGIGDCGLGPTSLLLTGVVGPPLPGPIRGLTSGEKVEFWLLMRLRAEGDGKLVSLAAEDEEDSLLLLAVDLAELNPLELEVLFPRPCCWRWEVEGGLGLLWTTGIPASLALLDLLSLNLSNIEEFLEGLGMEVLLLAKVDSGGFDGMDDGGLMEDAECCRGPNLASPLE